MLAELVPAEASFLGLQTAAFPLCPHGFCQWPPSGVSSPSCWIRRSPLRPHLTSITFLKTLQIQSLRVRLQMINWGGDTIHSTTPKIYALKIVIFNIFPFYFIELWFFSLVLFRWTEEKNLSGLWPALKSPGKRNLLKWPHWGFSEITWSHKTPHDYANHLLGDFNTLCVNSG